MTTPVDSKVSLSPIPIEDSSQCRFTDSDIQFIANHLSLDEQSTEALPGTKGDEGVTGPAGVKGAQGDKGAQGEPGPKGDTPVRASTYYPVPDGVDVVEVSFASLDNVIVSLHWDDASGSPGTLWIVDWAKNTIDGTCYVNFNTTSPVAPNNHYVVVTSSYQVVPS